MYSSALVTVLFASSTLLAFPATCPSSKRNSVSLHPRPVHNVLSPSCKHVVASCAAVLALGWVPSLVTQA